MKVKDILKDKGLEVIAVDSGSTVDTAVRKMEDRNIGALLVFEEGTLAGMFTERDVIKAWVHNSAFDKVQLKDVMTKNLCVVEPDNDLEEVMTVMTNEKIRHLPVIDKGKIVGLISIRDVVKYHIGNLKAEVHYLKDYILNQ